MSIYSKRMAYTFASLGLLWVSPFIYLAIKRFIPESFVNFMGEHEAALMAMYFGLIGAVYLFGKAWAYWGNGGLNNYDPR